MRMTGTVVAAAVVLALSAGTAWAGEPGEVRFELPVRLADALPEIDPFVLPQVDLQTEPPDEPTMIGPGTRLEDYDTGPLSTILRAGNPPGSDYTLTAYAGLGFISVEFRTLGIDGVTRSVNGTGLGIAAAEAFADVDFISKDIQLGLHFEAGSSEEATAYGLGVVGLLRVWHLKPKDIRDPESEWFLRGGLLYWAIDINEPVGEIENTVALMGGAEVHVYVGSGVSIDGMIELRAAYLSFDGEGWTSDEEEIGFAGMIAGGVSMRL